MIYFGFFKEIADFNCKYSEDQNSYKDIEQNSQVNEHRHFNSYRKGEYNDPVFQNNESHYVSNNFSPGYDKIKTSEDSNTSNNEIYILKHTTFQCISQEKCCHYSKCYNKEGSKIGNIRFRFASNFISLD